MSVRYQLAAAVAVDPRNWARTGEGAGEWGYPPPAPESGVIGAFFAFLGEFWGCSVGTHPHGAHQGASRRPSFAAESILC